MLTGCFSFNLLYAASIIVSLCKKLFCLFCLIYALMFMNPYQRHKKEERGNQESDRVLYTGPKAKMETDMYDLL